MSNHVHIKYQFCNTLCACSVVNPRNQQMLQTYYIVHKFCRVQHNELVTFVIILVKSVIRLINQWNTWGMTIMVISVTPTHVLTTVTENIGDFFMTSESSTDP